MKVTFEVKAFLPDYGELSEIRDGSYMPMLSTSGEWYAREGHPQIGTAKVIVEVFDDAQVKTNQLAALNTQLAATRAENQQRENAILDRISKLQALTFDPA